MKYKKMIALAALIIALVGCGPAAAAGDSYDRGNFYMIYQNNEGTFRIYQDYETGVQYIVFKSSSAGGIFPRLNADGTLYCGEVGNP